AQPLRTRRTRELCRVERASGGMIAAEVARIHGDRADRTGDTEPDDAPVMPTLRTAPAVRLPAVHPLATIGVLAIDERRGSRREQVVPERVEFVRRDQRPSADARAREVDETVPRSEERRVGEEWRTGW